jgi:hypothetical protein
MLLRQSWQAYEVDQPMLAASAVDPAFFVPLTQRYQLAECSGSLLFAFGAMLGGPIRE